MAGRLVQAAGSLVVELGFVAQDQRGLMLRIQCGGQAREAIGDYARILEFQDDMRK